MRSMQRNGSTNCCTSKMNRLESARIKLDQRRISVRHLHFVSLWSLLEEKSYDGTHNGRLCISVSLLTVSKRHKVKIEQIEKMRDSYANSRLSEPSTIQEGVDKRSLPPPIAKRLLWSFFDGDIIGPPHEVVPRASELTHHSDFRV